MAAIGNYWVVPPPGPPGLHGNASLGASYRGVIDPDSLAGIGLGVHGGASVLPTVVGAM